MQRVLLFILCLILAAGHAHAQEIENNLSFRNIRSERYFRVNYMNDLAFGTDYYFTQGVHFEYAIPARGSRLEACLFPFFTKHRRYTGIGLESVGYTPTSIFADSILDGDRPFAGMAYLKAFSMGWNGIRRERYVSALTLGWIGPAAGGYEIQAAIHRRTGNADPLGWKYQIGNALILNYELNYERALFMRKFLLLSATGMLRGGTYSIKAALGGVLIAGWFEDPFARAQHHKKLQGYLYVHPQVDIVGYDAALQGGLFTNNSPYTIEGKNVSRAVFRCDGGLRMGYRNVWIGVYARYLTKEFESGLDHATGGLELALPVR
jgi:hypothetical protein